LKLEGLQIKLSVSYNVYLENKFSENT